MKILAFNGSPRKSGNTAMLLEQALAGAAAAGAETELVHLYDLSYRGCVSCFACKRKGGASYGRCALRDELTPVLERAASADAFLFGSPLYLGFVTGEMQSLLERLVFPYLVYDKDRSSLFGRKIPTAFLYTMGMPEAGARAMGYDYISGLHEKLLGRMFGSMEALFVTDTYQFDDYSQYVATGFDAEAKAQRRRDVFPEDCRKAYAIGGRLAGAGSGE